ncbi:MAG TPA: 4-hydroxybenzoyl-CoA reductase subunit beta [Zeimonas sp.]|nr:4-hydroxybenzoyl-CoA reductase subunit beta [Zeimonas sp.]
MDALHEFEWKRPGTLAEAAALLAANPDARLVAGGTDLVPNLRRGIERPKMLVDLGGIAGFDAVERTRTGVSIGAGARLATLAAHPLLVGGYRAIAQAAGSVAGPAHRGVATIGGNLFLDTRCVYYNQSEWWRASNGYCLKRGGTVCHVAPQGNRCHAAFSGDLAGALIALRAEVELVSARGERRIALTELYRDDGRAWLTSERDEILARVFVPTPAEGLVSAYRKARVRASIDFPLAGVAVALAMREGVLHELRVGLTGTNSHPLDLAGVEAMLGHPLGDDAIATLGKLVQRQVSPMRTTVTQANYRRQVAAITVQRLVRELLDEARGQRASGGALAEA